MLFSPKRCIDQTVTELALASSLHAARKAFEKAGGKKTFFGPGVVPPKTRS